jgi:hypothetical protein
VNLCQHEKGAAMSLHIRPETEARIATLAAASGVSVDDYLSALVEKQSPGSEETGSAPAAVANGPRPRIWDVIAENMKNVPREDFEDLPKDGLSQIDYYVYGVPKRPA